MNHLDQVDELCLRLIEARMHPNKWSRKRLEEEICEHIKRIMPGLKMQMIVLALECGREHAPGTMRLCPQCYYVRHQMALDEAEKTRKTE